MVIKAPCKHCIPDEICLKCGDCERYKVYRKGVLKEKERDKQNEKENYTFRCVGTFGRYGRDCLRSVYA